jgi:hypothetical protein
MGVVLHEQGDLAWGTEQTQWGLASTPVRQLVDERSKEVRWGGRVGGHDFEAGDLVHQVEHRVRVVGGGPAADAAGESDDEIGFTDDEVVYVETIDVFAGLA